MHLANAIAVTRELKAALATEVENARAQRQVLRTFDGEKLFDMAVQRERFNTRASMLQARLAEALAQAGRAYQLPSVTLEALLAASPEEGEKLALELAEIRSLAAALAELDALNRVLADKALSCVRAYTQSLQPTVTAYDRRGLNAPSVPSSRSQRI